CTTAVFDSRLAGTAFRARAAGLQSSEGMAKKMSPPLTFRPRKERASLIEWSDPERQAQVLDWRHRAQDFGLAVESREDLDEGHPFAIEPERLLHEDEPE